MTSSRDLDRARRPAEVFPAGEFLRDELEARGWTQLDLAEILNRPPRVVNEVVTGKRSVSPETARGLGAALGTSPQFWMRLDVDYQLWKARDDDLTSVTRRARLYNYAPVRDMVRRGWIHATSSLDQLEERVCRFFEVRQLGDEPPVIAAAARKSTSYAAPYTPAQRAWLRRAEQLARTLPTPAFKAQRLNASLAQTSRLAGSVEDLSQVPQRLAELGIRLVIVEPLPGSRIDGACFWLDGPVVALSLRFNRIDNFWFVLLHELAHVRQRDIVALDTDVDAKREPRDRPQAEVRADAFATEQLVPGERLDEFIRQVRPSFTADVVEEFAQSLGVHPGIVVGQLQYRGELAWAQLRRLLVPVRDILTSICVTDGWGAQAPRLSANSGE